MNDAGDLLAGLTQAQAEAVSYRGGPLLIVAGPGSGKTEVITRRVAHLVASGQATDGSVLVTTFTEKAALELKDRIQAKAPSVNVEKMQVSTIHSLCHRLLEEFRAPGPFPRGVTVLDGPGQLLFVFTHRKDLGLGDILKGRACDFFAEVVRTYNLAAEEMVEPEQLRAHYSGRLEMATGRDKSLWEERVRIAESYARYLALLRDQQATDFANLQRHALDLLETQPQALRQVQQRFTDVLVDEYQDTNAVQDLLLCRIARPQNNLAAVGDDDQSIYRFRGATVRNILNFQDRHHEAKVVRLEQNFRSLEPIVDHSGRLIRKNPAHVEKDLEAVRQEPPNDILLVHERTAAEEAAAVADVLLKLKRDGDIKRYRDVAVLLRSVRSYGGAYVSAFEAAGVPCVVTGDGAFFDDPTVRQLCDLLTFLASAKPWADKFVRHPVLGLSSAACASLREHKENLASAEGVEALRKLEITQETDIRKLAALLALKRKVQDRRYGSFLEILHGLLEITGCFARCQADPGQTKNLGVLTRIVRRYDEYAATRNVYPFLEYLKLLKQGGLDGFRDGPQDAVSIMTVHQAKGLEFPVVVIGAAMEGRFPTRLRRARYVIPPELTRSGPPEAEDIHTLDERKLFYVGATRARDLLIIAAADVVNKRGGGPSRFIGELLAGKASGAFDMEHVLRRSRTSLDSGVKVKPPANPPRQPRQRLSYRQISLFMQCPLRYKYVVIDGIEHPWPESLYFGGNVHQALDEVHRRVAGGEAPDRIDVRAVVESAWSPFPGAREEAQAGLKAAATRQITEYLRKYEHTLRSVRDSETSFAFDFEGAVVSGRIDLVRQSGSGGAEIVDFKATASTKGPADETELQLDLYALGAELDLNLPVHAETVHFLSDNAEQSFQWRDFRRESTRRTLRDVLQRIRAGEFEPNTAYCADCEEFKAICPHCTAPRRRKA